MGGATLQWRSLKSTLTRNQHAREFDQGINEVLEYARGVNQEEEGAARAAVIVSPGAGRVKEEQQAVDPAAEPAVNEQFAAALRPIQHRHPRWNRPSSTLVTSPPEPGTSVAAAPEERAVTPGSPTYPNLPILGNRTTPENSPNLRFLFGEESENNENDMEEVD